MESKKTIIVDQITDSERLDIYLTKKFPKLSRTYFKTLIEESNIKINNKIIQKPSYLVQEGDEIEITFPPSPELYGLPLPEKDMGIEILYDHEDFLIVYKPAGILVHKPSTKSTEPTLVDWLIHHFKELKKVGHEDRPGIVHRLDKNTSGIIIIPKNNYSHKIFSNLFKKRNIEKTYLAVVKGHPEKTGIIDLSIKRHPTQKIKMSAKHHSGRESQTNYKVLKYFEDTSLIEAKPITGRTHQIRVHFAAIGHPLIGDTTYGTKSKLINRHALHAYKLAFNFQNKKFIFWRDLAKDMKLLIKKLEK